jgi:PAS domain S-box-containing protein
MYNIIDDIKNILRNKKAPILQAISGAIAYNQGFGSTRRKFTDTIVKGAQQMSMVNAVELKDLIDVSFLQDFQDNFAYSVGVASLTEDEHGNALTHPSCFSEFCARLIRTSETGSRRCQQCDVRGAEAAIRTGKPAVYECHAGLIDFAAPIMLDGRNIGAIFGGQILTEPPSEEKFRRIAGELGVDPEEYVAAVKKIPVISEEKLQAAAKVLFLVANTLSENAYQTLKIKERNRELVLANNHLSNILQTMSDGVITFDKHGIVTRGNPSSEEILGIKNQDLVGGSVKDILGDKGLFIEKLISYQQTFMEVEVMVNTQEGLVHCLASGKPILDDQDRKSVV